MLVKTTWRTNQRHTRNTEHFLLKDKPIAMLSYRKHNVKKTCEWVSGGVAPRSFNIGNRCVVSFMPRPLYHKKNGCPSRQEARLTQEPLWTLSRGQNPLPIWIEPRFPCRPVYKPCHYDDWAVPTPSSSTVISGQREVNLPLYEALHREGIKWAWKKSSTNSCSGS
jgi:hypothetical protein